MLSSKVTSSTQIDMVAYPPLKYDSSNTLTHGLIHGVLILLLIRNDQANSHQTTKLSSHSGIKMSSPNHSFDPDAANHKIRGDMTSFVNSPSFFELVLGKNNSSWNRARLKTGLMVLDLYSWLVSLKFCLRYRLSSKKSNFR